MMTNKQRRFIDEYLKDFNATQAAIRAGYSEKTAYSIGQENLKKPDISEAIKGRIEDLSMGSDERLITLAEIGRYSKRDSDRLRAIELLGKLAGDYVEKIDHGDISVRIIYGNDGTSGQA